MRPNLLFTALAFGAAILAACGGGSDSKDQPSPTIPVGTAQATATKAGGSQTTPVSANGTPTATTAAASPTAAPTTAPAESPTAAPTTSQPTPPPANTAVATAVPPTATPPPASNNPASASIGVTGGAKFFWSPANVTIAPGGTVTWAWNEPVQPHNVAGVDFAFGPTEITKSGAVSFTFTTPGTYHFTCEVHPDTMRGTVTVQ